MISSMRCKHAIASTRRILLLLAAFACPPASLATSSALQEALNAVEDCIGASPPAWPQAWRVEYVEAIRGALAVHEPPGDNGLRLDALREGVSLYWEGVKTSADRPLFELQCAEIRWYAGNLVSSVLPGEDDRDAIREQVKDLWQEAADCLRSQFPFLDPNIVCKARADHLQGCLRWVDAPLKPLFRQRFAPEQMDRIREGWHELRYARVDLMRELGGEDGFLAPRSRQTPLSADPDYLLTDRSLEQLEGYIWSIVARPPDDYVQAQQNHWKAQQRQRQRTLMAQAQEQHLKTERSRQLRQTEYLSFLLAVVLESAQQLDNPPAGEVAEGSDSRVEAAPWKEVMPMR